MTIEDQLTDLFAQQAERRPDQDAVLDAVHDRITARHRSTATRSAGAVGAAAAVAAIAIAATVLTEPSGHHADPADGPASVPATPSVSAPATPSTSAPATPHVSAPATPSTSAPATASSSAPAIPSSRPSAPDIRSGGSRNYSTINAGYLPGPATQSPAGTSNQPGFEERDWDVTVDGVAMDVIIWTESGPLPSRMQATGGTPDYRAITVNGHAGREFVSSSITIVAFRLGNGTVAYAGPSVRQTTPAVTTARITAIAVRVAEHMQFNRHDPIPGR